MLHFLKIGKLHLGALSVPGIHKLIPFCLKARERTGKNCNMEPGMSDNDLYSECTLYKQAYVPNIFQANRTAIRLPTDYFILTRYSKPSSGQ
jgi:hypothetical protein